MDFKVHKDIKEVKVILDHVDLLDHVVILVVVVLLVHVDLEEVSVIRDRKVKVFLLKDRYH